MASYLIPPIYAAFLWWFSTGAVLLIVGLSGRFELLRIGSAASLLVASLYGLAASSADASIGGAYLAFTCTVLLWGAQEIAFLAGWVTGPRPEICPPHVHGTRRLGFALQAILYHELMLLACGAAIAALTWAAANQIGLWTFATLWLLRQSAKINLFLGVPVTNDELMPDGVRFLKSFFARKSVSAFFPVSVTLATAALVIMIQRLVEVAATPFEIAGLALVSALFALGIVEHWFMLLPLPAMTLWGWGVKSNSAPDDHADDATPDFGRAVPKLVDSPSTLPEARSSAPQIVMLSARNETSPSDAKQNCARQRLEDQFRQHFLERHAQGGLAATLRGNGADAAASVNGRTS